MRWYKSRPSERRYALGRINSRLHIVEENISELEDRAT